MMSASPTGPATASIDACPDGQVVFIPEGIYRIDGKLGITKPITLRGAGAGTVLRAEVGDGAALAIGGLGPWPPPKANPAYNTPITGGAARASTTVMVADTAAIEVGKMIMVDEEDDPELVWTKGDAPGRYRASMHMVEAKTDTSVTFRPPLTRFRRWLLRSSPRTPACTRPSAPRRRPSTRRSWPPLGSSTTRFFPRWGTVSCRPWPSGRSPRC